jgi:hypothetical protein
MDQTMLPKLTEYSEDELRILREVAQYQGRPLTQQEINLSLDQARFIGELPERVLH